MAVYVSGYVSNDPSPGASASYLPFATLPLADDVPGTSYTWTVSIPDGDGALLLPSGSQLQGLTLVSSAADPTTQSVYSLTLSGTAAQMQAFLNNDLTFARTVPVAPISLAFTGTFRGAASGSSLSVSVGTALPDVTASFTTAVDAVLASTITTLLGGKDVPAVASVLGGSSLGQPITGDFTAAVLAFAGGAAGTLSLPGGYAAGYTLIPNTLVQDAGGGAALIGAAGSTTLIGSANDTLFGGNANATLQATAGAETLFGGTGTNLIELGAATAVATTQGTDTIVGSTGAATINASGAPIYFGQSGAAVFNATGTAATLVGGGPQTVNAGAANIEMFAGAGLLTYNAGSGLGTIVSGTGGASLTGGTGGLLYFGNGPTTYVAGTAVDTVLGFTGSLTATGGANGTLIFTGTAGNNVVGSGSGSATVIGLGANDLLTATGSGKDILSGTGAADTIDGSQSSGSNAYFAYGNNAVVQGGSGQTAIESFLGNQTLIGGSGSTLFELVASGTARTVSIANFNTNDFVQLNGYATGAGAAAVAKDTVSGGSTTIALVDGTKVTFQGVTNLSANSFV